MISRWHVTGYFIGQALAGGIYTFVSLIVVKRCVGRIEWAPWAEIRTLLKSVFRTSVSVYFAKLARGFSLQIPVLVAGLYLPLAAVGWLKFGMQAGGYAATVISAAQVVTLPRMTNYLKQYGPEYLFKRFGDNFRRLSSIIGCILIGAVAAAPELIRLVGTDRFVGSFKPFQLIIAFYVFIVLADSIFSGIHFPLNREASYVFSYLVYFALAVAVSSLSVVLLNTPESAAFGLVLGAMFHYAIAIFQTRRYPTLFTVLVKSCWKMLVVIIVATTLFFMEVLIQRYVLSVIGILFLALELSKNDPGIRHKISQITSNLKLR
jgi:O-antigen/teichoic acid export membrane protein